MATCARLLHVWLDRQVRVGYESGIWHRMILQSVILHCLALVWDHRSADHRQPIVIAFASQGSEEELGGEGTESGRNVSGSGTGWNPEAVCRQRLASSGAKTGDIQISLMWDGHDDIDLHVTHRFGSHVDTIF